MKNFTAAFMKPFFLAAALAAMLAASGCVVYTQYPPVRTISGQILRADDGQPVPYATLFVYSGRKHIGFATNYDVDAQIQTGKDGTFTITARLNDTATVTVYHNNVFQEFPLPAFPANNTIENLVYRVKEAPPPAPVVSEKHWWQFWK